MKRLASVLAAATLLASGSAHAKDYGDAGVIEIGGSVGFSNTTTTMTDDDSDEDVVDETSTGISISPDIYYYLAPGLPLVASLSLGMDSTKDEIFEETTNDTDVEAAIGAGYLVPVGKARIGPLAQAKFISRSSKSDSDEFGDSESTQSGPGVRLAGVAKMPVESGGVITAGLFVDYNMLAYESEGYESDITEMNIGVAVGFGVWF